MRTAGRKKFLFPLLLFSFPRLCSDPVFCFFSSSHCFHQLFFLSHFIAGCSDILNHISTARSLLDILGNGDSLSVCVCVCACLSSKGVSPKPINTEGFNGILEKAESAFFFFLKTVCCCCYYYRYLEMWWSWRCTY